MQYISVCNPLSSAGSSHAIHYHRMMKKEALDDAAAKSAKALGWLYKITYLSFISSNSLCRKQLVV
jgi:hypothetical protein